MKLSIAPKDYLHHYSECIGILSYPDFITKENEEGKVFFSLGGIAGKKVPNDYMTGSYAFLDSRGEKNTQWQSLGFLFDNPRIDLIFPWPSLGLINMDTDVVKVTRVPVHHWKRGYHRNSLKVESINYWENFLINVRNLDRGQLTNPLVLKKIFDAKYYTPREAYRLVTNGEKLSAAISPIFCLKMQFNSDDVFLVYRNMIAGIIRESYQRPLEVQLFEGNEFLEEQVREYYNIVK
jgi:hypothetical protein